MTRPHVVEGAATEEPVDARVAAVLEVLHGTSVGDVAARWHVEAALLHRWVLAFVEAGAAQVTHRPPVDVALQRDRFLAAFAHELRTPLAVARGWVSLLLDDEVPADQVGASLQRLHGALEDLTDRIVAVELVAAASLGLLAMEPRRVSVATLVRPLLERGGLDGLGEVGGAGGEVELVVDPGLFRQVLRDLWDASSTSPAPRRRQLDVLIVEPWIELRIVREAEPIPPGVLRALFEPFDLNHDGTGVTLGLYLARALTVAHGGTMGVDQDDDGAVLWVRIPSRSSMKPSIKEDEMTFKLACGDVLPGCAARFETPTKDELMQQIAAHAGEAHGITELTPEVAAAVESKIVVA